MNRSISRAIPSSSTRIKHLLLGAPLAIAAQFSNFPNLVGYDLIKV